jgi:hypothetical protein
MSNLVLACHITGVYDVNRNMTLADDSYELVRAWAESVVAANLQGIIFHNNFSEETCARYQNEHISFVRVNYNPQFNPNVYRYFVYRDYLAEHTDSIQGVFVTDVSDVTIAQNPFIHPFYTGMSLRPCKTIGCWRMQNICEAKFRITPLMRNDSLPKRC